MPDQGTYLPYLQQQQSTPWNTVVAHGLGTDPPQKTHMNDISYDLWRDCQAQLKHLQAPNTGSEAAVVYYTARGHGKSYGWDKKAKEQTCLDSVADFHTANVQRLAEPFTWPALGRDMAAVVNEAFPTTEHIEGGSPPLTIFGQSMGAATAIFYAMQQDTIPKRRINALILARLPRIWEARQKVSKSYVQSAEEYRLDHPQSHHFLPFLAASTTDLPRPDDEQWKQLKNEDLKPIPVLLLCHGSDDTHPLESGRLLKEKVLSHATLHDAASDEDEARRTWPNIMAEWLLQVSGDCTVQ